MAICGRLAAAIPSMNKALLITTNASAPRVNIHHRVGEQLLELSVLRFQRLQALRFRDVHSAKLPLPAGVARLTESVLAA